MLNRPEEALAHLKLAERPSLGWHVMWLVISWQSVAYRDLGRLAEAEAARDQSFSLNPVHAFDQVHKALLCALVGREAEARGCIEIARRLGWDLALAERAWRRTNPNSPTLEADLAIVRALYAATEPGA